MIREKLCNIDNNIYIDNNIFLDKIRHLDLQLGKKGSRKVSRYCPEESVFINLYARKLGQRQA